MVPRTLFSLAACLALTCLMVLLPAIACGSVTEDIALVKSRVIAHQTSPSVSTTTVTDLRSTLASDGTWPGIDYASTAHTGWPPGTHLSNLRTLARAYAKPDNPYQGDASLLEEMNRAFDAWISLDPQSTNWWHNEIFSPQMLGEIMLLIEDDLTSSRKTSGLSRIARAYIPRSTNSGTNTGANRIDRAYASLMRGLLAPDAALVSESILAIGDTVLVSTAEGIQPDQSFHQHGAQLHIHGYGASFLGGVARYGKWVAGTSFAYNPLQVRVLVDFLIDGVQWYIRGDSLDFTSYGRTVTRAPQAALAASFRTTATDVLDLSSGYRTTELEAFSARLEADVAAASASAARAHIGTRHFWQSDSTTHHRPKFSVFLKTSSTRTRQPETGNGEGLKNLHLADGVTLLMRDGNEYDDIMPVWNWRNLPGTTTEQGTYSLKPPSDWGVAGTATHVGAATSGNDAVAAYYHQRLSVNARKSWFLFDDRLIALGSDIQRPSGTAAVMTCVNDCLLRGSVHYSSNGSDALALTGGNTLPASALRWVHHDGIGYYFPSASTPASVRLSSASRSGSWQSLNTSQSSSTVTHGVFSVQIDHGIAPASGSYAYIAAPVDDPSAMPDHPAFAVEILRQDATAHAVRDAARGLTGANFWQAGAVADITASAPACVLVARDTNRLDVSLADPTYASTGDLVVDIAVSVEETLHVDSRMTVEPITGGMRLRATRAALQGRTVRAAFSLRPHAYEILEIPAQADAFVHDGNPDQSYGTGETLATKLISNPGYTRISYLRFAVPPLSAPPAAASLQLFSTSANGPGLHGLLPIETSAWTESSLTWNNRPQPRAAPLALWLPAANTAVSVDVSAEMPVLWSSGGTTEFSIAAQTIMSDGFVQYAAREHITPSFRPMLRVAVPRTELEIWRRDSFGDLASDPAIAGDLADPDGDGLNNFHEFAFGLNPTHGASNNPITATLDITTHEFRYTRHPASGLAYTIESSTDLQSWKIQPSVQEVVLPSGGNPETVEVTLTDPPPGGRLFVRVRAE